MTEEATWEGRMSRLEVLVQVQSDAALRIERCVEKSITANAAEHTAMWKRIDAKAEASKVAYHDKLLFAIVSVPIIAGGIWAVMDWIKNQVGGAK